MISCEVARGSKHKRMFREKAGNKPPLSPPTTSHPAADDADLPGLSIFTPASDLVSRLPEEAHS